MDATELEKALGANALCERIVRFFMGHTDAVDTLEGIADWWVQEDRRLTREAIGRLVELGIVIRRVRGGRELFTYTTDVYLRSTVEQWCAHRPSRVA